MGLLHHTSTTCPRWQLVTFRFPMISPFQAKTRKADATYLLVSMVKWSGSKIIIIHGESGIHRKHGHWLHSTAQTRTDMRTQGLADHCLELWLCGRILQARTWQVIEFIRSWAIETNDGQVRRWILEPDMPGLESYSTNFSVSSTLAASHLKSLRLHLFPVSILCHEKVQPRVVGELPSMGEAATNEE